MTSFWDRRRSKIHAADRGTDDYHLPKELDLKAGGFSEQQANTQARALAEVLDRQMATKAEVTRWVFGAGVLQTTIIIGILLKVAKLV